MTFTRADFKPMPRGPYLFNIWEAKEQVSTFMGPWKVELTTELEDAELPNDEMVVLVNQIIAAVLESQGDILEAVYAHYLLCREDRLWMKEHNVPRNLGIETIVPYIGSRTISVSRRKHERIDGGLCVSGRWDSEHATLFDWQDGRLVQHH